MRRALLIALVLVSAPVISRDAASAPPVDPTPASFDSNPPPAPGVPQFAMVTSFESDSVLARNGAELMAAFRGVFADEAHATQRKGESTEAPVVSVPMSNHFRLLEGTGSWGVWQIRLSIDSLRARPAPAMHRSRGATSSKRVAPAAVAGVFPGIRVTITLLPPDAPPDARPIVVNEELRFAVGEGGDDAPAVRFARQAGRVVALRTLEELSHRAGELDAGTRLRWEGRP